MIGPIGLSEMIIIFAVLLLLFGAKRLPELATGMGRGIRDFKRAVSGLDDASIQAATTQQTVQSPAPQPQLDASPAPAEARKES